MALWAWFTGLLFAVPCFGETGDPHLDFLILLWKSVGEMKGAATIMIVATVIQLAIKGLDLPVANAWFSGRPGWIKLTVVSGLTMVITPISLVVSAGLTWGAALVHSATLTAVSVFANQIWKHVVKKEQ